MFGYQDYGYRDDRLGYAHSYLWPLIIGLLKGVDGPILDLGCGNGALVNALVKSGFDAYGVDASPTGIEIGKRHNPMRVHLHDVTLSTLPPALAGIAFSYVISTEVIEHLYEPRALLRFAKRVLRPGGCLIVSTPYHGYLKNVALASSGRLDAHFTVGWDGGHIKFFSRRTLTGMLEQEGFSVTNFAGAGRLLYLWKSMILKSFVVV